MSDRHGNLGGWVIAGLAAAAVLAAGSARADGATPFYGYSGYYGGPAVFYTRDPDVQQATRPIEGKQGIGQRTYTTGGPFFGYKPTATRRLPVRREAIRVRG